LDRTRENISLGDKMMNLRSAEYEPSTVYLFKLQDWFIYQDHAGGKSNDQTTQFKILQFQSTSKGKNTKFSIIVDDRCLTTYNVDSTYFMDAPRQITLNKI